MRLGVGDTSTSAAGQLLSSAEVTFIRTLESSYKARIARAARILAGKYATGALSKKVGDLQIDKDPVKHYLALAAEYDALGIIDVSPFLGGRSDSAKDDAEDDSDRVAPWFSRNMLAWGSTST